jgi:hypothetical protein
VVSAEDAPNQPASDCLLGGAVALTYAGRGWRGIFIGERGAALESIGLEGHASGQTVA